MPEDKKEVEPVISDKTWERIDKQQVKGKTMTSTNIDELLANAGVKAVDATPTPSSPTQPAEVKPDGTYLGAFRAGDGRFLHKYVDSKSREGFLVLPKKLEDMTDEDFFSSALSISETTKNRIPQDLTVKFRDPQWAGYWFNRKAGGEGSEGKSVSRGLALGFVPAKREDCEWVMPGLNDGDGSIINGDLVLMKIHKMRYFREFVGAYYEEAKLKGAQKSYQNAAENMVGGTSKVSHYLTPQANEMHGLGPVVHIPTVS